jgi:hypothetical protein
MNAMSLSYVFRHLVPVVATLTAVAVTITSVPVRAGEPPRSIPIPKNATALEGLPRVRVETTKDGTSRRELDPAEAATSRLTIRIDNGRLYWAGRDDRPLTVTSSNEFTYLLSTHPGRYVRFRWLNGTLAYVEHVDMAFGSVTYWGELRIVTGKQE